MRRLQVFVLLLLATTPAWTQGQEDSFSVYGDHPRLFLGTKRLKLLRRERERQSLRWQQLENLIAGKAPMPEPGFSYALYYRTSDDQDIGRRAVAWALGAGTDLRQLALVFDWCQPLLSPAEKKNLMGKLVQGIEGSSSDSHVSTVRGRVLAAIALGGEDENPTLATRVLSQTVREWWEQRIAPELKQGRGPLERDDSYPLFELLHALRDNLNIELRDSAPRFFKDLPIFQLLSYYPATYPAAENEYRIPASATLGEPDLRRAALSRAAELSMVAYDVNAAESQVLQGWLMHDHFLMRGTFGIGYEFLWANPYQPGLSYFHIPLVYHDAHFGRLLIRSSWEDDATWLGYFDGKLQIFRDGQPALLNLDTAPSPVLLPDAVVVFGKSARKFRVQLQEDQEEAFVLGLKPHHRYDVEVDGEEMRELEADTGGILALDLPRKVEIGVRLREAPARR